MKKLILSSAFVVFAIGLSSAKNKESNAVEFNNSHEYCKAQALSVAYTLAYFYEDGEPRVSDFKNAYRTCRGL